MKDLTGWLHYQALKWRMPGLAHQHDLSGIWHRPQGPVPCWSNCGRTWLDHPHIRRTAGKHQKRQSPWWGQRAISVKTLCPRCFAEEIPLLEGLAREPA